jgi:hypothetical protein
MSLGRGENALGDCLLSQIPYRVLELLIGMLLRLGVSDYLVQLLLL